MVNGSQSADCRAGWTADLYAFNLCDRIPLFSIPLQLGERELVVDLQLLLDEVYDRSGYRYFIDYSENPVPPLAPAELDWLEGLLKEQELR